VAIAPRLFSWRRAIRYSPDFAAAHANFEAAWREYLPNRHEANFQAWRDQEVWTGRLDEDRNIT
jgi:hypothetical protein